MNKKLFQPTDLQRVVYPSDVTISRNGQRGAWVESKSSDDRGCFISKIYLVELPSGKISEVNTPGGDDPQHPRLLCEGDKLLYLGKRSGTYQIYLRDLVSGTDRKITSARHGVKRFSVSEDESAIAFETTLGYLEKMVVFDLSSRFKSKSTLFLLVVFCSITGILY